MRDARIEARNACLERDNYKCVFCGYPADDAHHLLERRLWEDGGYYVDNLISVCEKHHRLWEQTVLSVEEGRTAAGITKIVVPAHLYEDQRYDKWGNPILPSGSRLMGELFEDEGVQRVLKQGGMLDRFVLWMKYPRTYHLPWSFPNRNDRSLASTTCFEGRHVVVTEKLDGECTSMYNDKIHARAIDSHTHPSRSWVKNLWSQFAHDIPYGYRICGENVYARHSIQYDELETFFYGFSVWDKTQCLNWHDTLEWFDIFGITPVKVLYEGMWDERAIRSIPLDTDKQEGYVVRVADAFPYRDFRMSVAKFVRENHIQTHERWDTRWTLNSLKTT